MVDPDGVSASELERAATNFWLRIETITRWNSLLSQSPERIKNLVVIFDTGSLFHFISFGNLLDLSIEFKIYLFLAACFPEKLFAGPTRGSAQR